MTGVAIGCGLSSAGFGDKEFLGRGGISFGLRMARGGD